MGDWDDWVGPVLMLIGILLAALALSGCDVPTAPRSCERGTLTVDAVADARRAALDRTTSGCAYWTVHTPQGPVYVTVECQPAGWCGAWITRRPIG